jgi:hypothetical protein
MRRLVLLVAVVAILVLLASGRNEGMQAKDGAVAAAPVATLRPAVSRLLNQAVAHLVVTAYASAAAGKTGAKPMCNAIRTSAQQRLTAALNTALAGYAPRARQTLDDAARGVLNELHEYVLAQHCTAAAANPAVKNLPALQQDLAKLSASLAAPA